MVNSGWIGVDFDGTLAEYHGWSGWNVFGKPIPTMVERVVRWLADGREVRIVTARVGVIENAYSKCRHTGVTFTNHDMRQAIQDWCEQYIGARLPVQCYKDVNMVELWDDRAVQVVTNTGMRADGC